MRPDAAGPRTWLLAVVAGWALAVLLLALAGLGARVVPLADDPSLAQDLPLLAPAAPSRLADLQAYAQTHQRPLFHRERRPQPFVIGGGGEVTRDFDFVLTSVLITPRLRMAILQPSEGGESVRVREGASPGSLPNWQLVEVRPRSASFMGPDGPRTLELRVFDGRGGAAPTAMGVLPATPIAGGPAQPPVAGPAAGRNAAPQPTPADRSASLAESAGAPAPAANAPADEPTLSTQQQMDAIRQRIEARRAQLREAQDAPTTPDQTR